MKKRNLFSKIGLVISVIFTSSFGIAQQVIHQCYTNQHMDELKQSDPALKFDMEQSELELEQFTAHYIANEYDPSARTAIYTIPVVFHILHTNGAENISDEQVWDAVARLNDDFNKLNASWTTVHPSFLGIVGDIQIEFKLARKTNTGACTNGITRTYTTTTNDDVGNAQVTAVQSAQGNWPGNKYLNIFVVNEANGAAGYTTYPSNMTATSMSNGIKILHSYVGGIGTGNPSYATALSHEVGHWLNLRHVWGNSNYPGCDGTDFTNPGCNGEDNCDEDDLVTDTPNSIGWTACNVNGISCGSLNNVENYMEYSGCRKMFTNGQKARMHAALNSSTGDRDNVWSLANLSATGVSLPDVLCQVVFSGDKTEICVGESVTFTDNSYNYVSGTNWTFAGGSPATSTAASPTITYNTPGVYNVTLQATDGSTTVTGTKTAYIIVLANPGDPLPYSEGFETLSSFPDNQRFTRIDADGDEKWVLTSTASSSGNFSVKLNNYGTTQVGTIDAFASGPIDLSGVASADDMIFTFRYAYRKKTSTDDEWLKFYISDDCGETWVLRKQWHGNSLSAFTATGSYSPPDESAWYSEEVNNINNLYYVANFRYKFEFKNDGGNNIFIDDINLYPTSMTGIIEKAPISGLSIYPNPVNDLMEIRIDILENADYSITLINVLGELVSTVYQGELIVGTNQLSYSAAALPKGVYFLRIESNGIIETKKLIKN